jgi:hypothetical protein
MAQITNKLLKQAIADAEAVRETAMANAKLVLEEAIAPQVKEMIARRLRVEADMEHAEEEMEDTPSLEKKAPEMEEASELPFEDGEADGSTEMPADTSVIGSGDNKEPSDESFDTSDIGTGPEAVTGSEEDWYEDWDEADFDLGEIIKELENDIAALSGDESESDEEEMEMDMDDDDDDEMESDEEMSTEPVEEAKKEEKEEEKEELKESEHSEEDDEEVNLDEILAELEAEESPEEEDEKSAMMHKLAGLKNELAQYREAVKVLSGRLQEVNLLNAKLLFTNKIFRKEGLNNDQKVRIVESFDRATTVREVKLVYAALVENLSTQAKAFNTSRKKVVAEGLASKATPSTAPKSKEVIVENTVAKRLQELAGII